MKNPAFKGLMALAAVSLASVAQADLIVEVQRYGDGLSRWIFSGSAAYSEIAAGGKFAGGDLANIEEWKGDGASDYVKGPPPPPPGTYNNYVTDLISGSIGLSVTPDGGSPITGSVDGLHIDHDNSGDDFGVSLVGSDILLSSNAVVSWSGEGIFAVDVAKLNEGAFTFLRYGGSSTVPGQIYGTLPIKMTVPEPGSALLLLAGLAGLMGSAIRRQRAV